MQVGERLFFFFSLSTKFHRTRRPFVFREAQRLFQNFVAFRIRNYIFFATPSRLSFVVVVVRNSHLLLLVRNSLGQPVKTLIYTIPRCRARALNIPLAIAQRIQLELVSDLGRVHRVG